MKPTTTWKFVNHTTGMEIECNDLRFMLHEITEVHGLNLPQFVDVDMILRGRGEYEVTNYAGEINHVVIGEDSPARGIYFEANELMHQLRA